MDKNSKIFIAGHNGLIGSAIVRRLQRADCVGLNWVERNVDLTLTDQVNKYFDECRPEYVFLAAAKSGTTKLYETCPADILYNNLAIQTNVIHAAYKYGVKKLMFFGASSIYPSSSLPITEELLSSGNLDSVSHSYAFAKINGIQMCKAYRKQYGCDFISVILPNIYGKADKFYSPIANIIPSLLYKFATAVRYKATSITCMGNPDVRREMVYVDDVADACVFLMNSYSDSEIINVGANKDCSPKEIMDLLALFSNYTGTIEWDTTKSDEIPDKILDSTKLFNLGWKPTWDLYRGLCETMKTYTLNSI